jgi:hypothetical protein
MAPISSYIERERRKKEARELNAPYKKFRVYGKYSEQSLIDAWHRQETIRVICKQLDINYRTLIYHWCSLKRLGKLPKGKRQIIKSTANVVPLNGNTARHRENVSRLQVWFPKEELEKFKRASVDDGISLMAAIRESMEMWLESRERP